MVLHEDESVEDYPTLVQVMRELREKSLAVIIAVKNVRAAVAASSHMVDCAGKINAWWARHVVSLSSPRLPCNR